MGGCRFVIAALIEIYAGGTAAGESVTVGWDRTAALAPEMIATDKGYFSQRGLNVNLEEFRGSANMVSALTTGQIDVSLGGVTAGFFNSIARGLDARVVAPLSIQPASPGLTPLVARRDLWDAKIIRSAADLKARKVAVNAPGNGVEYKLSLILASAGLTLKDIDLTRLGFSEMMVALGTDGIDAAVLAQPFAVVAVDQHLAVLMMKESEAGHGDVTTLVLYSGKFMREHHKAAVLWLQGLLAGMRDLTEGKWRNEENLAILTKYLRLDRQLMLKSSFPDFDLALDIESHLDSLQRQEAMQMKNGYLQYTAPLPASAYIDPSFAREAVAKMPISPTP